MKKHVVISSIILVVILVLSGWAVYNRAERLQACQEFAEASDKLVLLAANALDLSSQAITAAVDMDEEKIDQINADYDKLNPKIGAAVEVYNTSRAACTGEKMKANI